MRAAVLTGGASRRMGTPKATLLVDGEPMAERVAAAARAAGATAVAAVGRPVPGAVSLVEDDPGAGPLAALLAALRWADGDVALVLACDLLTPSAAAMAGVVAALEADPDADAAVPVVRGRAQWLHGAWRTGPAVVAALGEAWAGGVRSVHGAAGRIEVLRWEAPDDGPFQDADRPEDLPRGRPSGPDGLA